MTCNLESCPLHSVISTLARETVATFEWLAEPVQRSARVSFYPNPGNVGDAAINLACWRYLSARFEEVEICAPDGTPSHRDVFVGGGGNLVENYYEDIATFLTRLEPGRRLYIFPSTVVGYGELMSRISPFVRIVCREPVSYAHVTRVLPPDRVALGHDFAFALGPALRERFAVKIAQLPKRVGQLFRADRERARPDTGGVDVFGQMIGFWNDMTQTERVLDAGVRILLGYGVVHTDRLHGGILAGILGRQTVLYPNSYFKNEAVFRHSLARLDSVTFASSAS